MNNDFKISFLYTLFKKPFSHIKNELLLIVKSIKPTNIRKKIILFSLLLIFKNINHFSIFIFFNFFFFKININDNVIINKK